MGRYLCVIISGIRSISRRFTIITIQALPTDNDPVMRIALVSYEYPPQQGLGGVGSYMFRLAGALGQAGHEVHVIAGPSTFEPVDQPNVRLHRISAQHVLSGGN